MRRALPIIGLLALCACAPESESRTRLPEPSLETLDRLAERACLCGMAGRDFSAITTEFERLTAGLSDEGLGTASTPLSSDIVCFPELGERACVLTQMHVVASPQDFVCTEDQASELETVWNRLLPESGHTAAADTALLERLNAMRDDLKLSLAAETCDRI